MTKAKSKMKKECELWEKSTVGDVGTTDLRRTQMKAKSSKWKRQLTGKMCKLYDKYCYVNHFWCDEVNAEDCYIKKAYEQGKMDRDNYWLDKLKDEQNRLARRLQSSFLEQKRTSLKGSLMTISKFITKLQKGKRRPRYTINWEAIFGRPKRRR